MVISLWRKDFPEQMRWSGTQDGVMHLPRSKDVFQLRAFLLLSAAAFTHCEGWRSLHTPLPVSFRGPLP